MVGNTITGLQLSIVQSIKNVQRLVDNVQESLASGKDVNSAIDSPQNFFTSKALIDRAGDISKLLDGIGLSIRTIQETEHGIEAIIKLLDQAEAFMQEAITTLFEEFTTIVSAETLRSENPNTTYVAETDSFYQFISTPQRVFNAIDAANTALLNGVGGHLVNITSQFENTFIDGFSGTSTIWIGASDAIQEGTWIWTQGKEAGLNFWNGDETGTPVSGTYNNWRSIDPDDGATGQDYAVLVNGGLWDDFGPPFQINGTNNFVIEWDGILVGLGADEELINLAASYSQQYSEILMQIDQIAIDTQIRGLGLLKDDDLRTDFNEDSSSFLITEGMNATSSGLGLTQEIFRTKESALIKLDQIRNARETMRAYSKSLQTDLSILTTRQDFSLQTINFLEAGADDLTVVDQNRKGAEMLALQTRQLLQFAALSLASQNTALRLFS